MFFPTSLDELIRDSRARISRLRRQHGRDFDHHVRVVIHAYLDELYDRRTIAYVMRAIFD